MRQNSKNPDSIYRPEWHWNGRSLANYKSIHSKTAADKGVSKEFEAAKTLTQARKILNGYKKGQQR